MTLEKTSCSLKKFSLFFKNIFPNFFFSRKPYIAQRLDFYNYNSNNT